MAGQIESTVVLVILSMAYECEASSGGPPDLDYIVYCYLLGCPPKWWKILLITLGIAITIVAVISCCYCMAKRYKSNQEDSKFRMEEMQHFGNRGCTHSTVAFLGQPHMQHRGIIV